MRLSLRRLCVRGLAVSRLYISVLSVCLLTSCIVVLHWGYRIALCVGRLLVLVVKWRAQLSVVDRGSHWVSSRTVYRTLGRMVRSRTGLLVISRTMMLVMLRICACTHLRNISCARWTRVDSLRTVQWLRNMWRLISMSPWRCC